MEESKLISKIQYLQKEMLSKMENFDLESVKSRASNSLYTNTIINEMTEDYTTDANLTYMRSFEESEVECQSLNKLDDSSIQIYEQTKRFIE